MTRVHRDSLLVEPKVQELRVRRRKLRYLRLSRIRSPPWMPIPVMLCDLGCNILDPATLSTLKLVFRDPPEPLCVKLWRSLSWC